MPPDHASSARLTACRRHKVHLWLKYFAPPPPSNSWTRACDGTSSWYWLWNQCAWYWPVILANDTGHWYQARGNCTDIISTIVTLWLYYYEWCNILIVVSKVIHDILRCINSHDGIPERQWTIKGRPWIIGPPRDRFWGIYIYQWELMLMTFMYHITLYMYIWFYLEYEWTIIVRYIISSAE